MSDPSDPIDPKQARLEHECPTPGILFAACFDAATGTLYGAGTDFAVYRVDTKAEKPAAEKKWTYHDSYISSLVWREGIIISGGFDRRLIWTRAESGEKVRELVAHAGWVRDLVLFPGAARLASAGDDMLVKLWDAMSGELVRTFDGHEKQTPEGFATALYAVAASPDGKHLASADRIGHVCLWEVETGKLLTRLKAEAFYTYDAVKRARSIGGIRSLSFLPDGRLVLGGIGQVTNVDGFVGPCRVELWDLQAEKRVYVGLEKHQAILDHVELHRESGLLIGTGGGDAGPIFAIWDLKAEPPVHKAKPKSHIQHFVFDSAGTRLFAVGHGGFQLWTFTAVKA